MKKSPFIGLFLATCIFWGCPQRVSPTVEILPEIKDNTIFKPGTYWIYIDSLTQDVIDSVYVISLKDTLISQDEVYGDCSFTHSQMRFKSEYYQKEARQGVLVDCPAPKSMF